MPVGLTAVILIVAVAGIIYAAVAAKHKLKTSTRIVTIIFLVIISVLACVYLLLAAALFGGVDSMAYEPFYLPYIK